MELATLKTYMRVDYDDDDVLIQMLLDAVLDEMEELIPAFDREKITNRQKLLICVYVKDLYDNRDRMEKGTAGSNEKVRFAVQSLILKEKLRNA